MEPPEDHVKFRGVADESEHASNLLGAPKASEEKKQIAASHMVPREMALRGARLPEDWTPSRGARDRVAPQIGIEMRTVASADAAARQVFDNRRDGRTSIWRDFRVGRRRTGIRNGKRAQPTVQYWTGASTVLRVESLAAEYEFHVICEAGPA